MKSDQLSQKSQPGFTLVEVLIAMTLSSIVLLGLTAVYQGIVSMAEKTKIQEQENYKKQSVTGLLESDIVSIYTEGDCALVGSRNSNKIHKKSVLLEFCTTSSLMSNDWVAFTRVQYGIKRAESGLYELFRREKPLFGEHFKNEMWLEFALHRELEEVRFRYYDRGQQRFVNQWSQENLPSRVQLSIHDSSGEATYDFHILRSGADEEISQ